MKLPNDHMQTKISANVVKSPKTNGAVISR
jgi:hypothetical protein